MAKTVNNMKSDWESRHKIEQMKAVMGKDMPHEQFMSSGEEEVEKLFDDFTQIRALKSCIAIDFGCGPGRISNALSNIFGKVIAVDISSTALDSAKNNLKRHNNVHYILSEGESIPLGDSAADFFISFDVFQHMPSADVQLNTLSEVSRVLKNNGTFFIQVKCNTGWIRILGIPIFPRKFKKIIPLPIFNIWNFNKRDDRKKSTWRGTLMDYSSIREVFMEKNLKITSIKPHGRDTRWMVKGICVK
ncbi:class I SAM-dependent methyltransferase [bacterium]|nr:class I SAM-dependent methyltransferase [bacterium]